MTEWPVNFPPETVAAMLDVADRAYASRVEEVLAWALDDAQIWDPEFFVRIDVEQSRRNLERYLREDELDDWPDLTDA